MAALAARARLAYHVFRNPSVMFGFGPAFVFIVGNRLAGAGASGRERFSVHVTNAALVADLAIGHFTIGLPTLLLTMLPLLAGAIGVWLFHVQPRIPFYNLQDCQDTIPAF